MDTLSQFCTRIRNATMAGHRKVDIPGSRIQVCLAEELKRAGYVRDYKVVEDGRQGIIRIYLRYNQKDRSMITKIERISRPSCRRYVKADQIPDVMAGRGLVVLSTNQGVLNSREARKRGVGGELLCRVW